MELKDIGERRAIEIMAELYGTINLDDCATIDAGDEFFLVTTDMLNEATHFPEGATPYQTGWFAVAVNLSDIAAKGGNPAGIVLSLGLPRNTGVDFIREFSDGAHECARKFGIKIIGGDTKEMDSITICGTALGMVKKKEFMPRMGARNGDIICVTGELGSAGISLQNLKRGKDGEAVKKILLISPRIREGRAAALTHGVTASMDISDGLASSLYQLLKINGVGFSVRAEKIPVDREAKFEKNAIDLAIYSGGDYELLFTVSPDMVDNVKKAVEGVGCKITDIGTVIKEKKVILLDGEVERRMENRGYEHFLSGGKTL